MCRKLTIAVVKQEFKGDGCKLLAKSYKDAKTPMPYICVCGRKSRISYDSFRRGTRCKACGRNKQAGKRRLSLEFVRDSFLQRGLILLATKYVNAQIPLDYICVCGRHAKMSWANFSMGQKSCRKCSAAIRGKKQRLSIVEVRSRFLRVHLTLLTEDYFGWEQQLEYRCNDCGYVGQTTVASVSQGCGCSVCKSRKISDKLRHSYEYVAAYFSIRGCVLLSSDYGGNTDLLDFVCVCGNVSKITFQHFREGALCRQCGAEKTKQKAWKTRRLHRAALEQTSLDALARVLKDRRKLGA